MAVDQRIKGLEVRVTFTSPDGTEIGLGDTQSFEYELQLETIAEGYLGERSKRRDDIFNGIRGRAEFHISKREAFEFAEKVKRRAQRRDSAAGVFNAIGAFLLPNGSRVRALVQNIFFGPIPFNSASREDYVKFSVDFEAEDVVHLFA